MDDTANTAMNKEGEVETSRDAVLVLRGKKGGAEEEEGAEEAEQALQKRALCGNEMEGVGKVGTTMQKPKKVACYIR